MPPFPAANGKSSASQQQRRSVASSDSGVLGSNNMDLDFAMLKPRSLDSISLALLPLEPLSSFGEATGGIHFTNDLERRDTLDTQDKSAHQLSRRALQTNVIPLSYDLRGAKPGLVVGATLGAVAGFLLLVWLIWILTTGQSTAVAEGSTVESIHVRHRSDRSRKSRRARTHRSEMSERSASAPPPPRRRERILVEETRRRERSSMPPPPAEPIRSPEREIHEVEVEEERRVDGDDVVEVIEEQSVSTAEPPRRKKSGYRTVDPNQYGGGNYPQREIYDSDRRKSKRHR